LKTVYTFGGEADHSDLRQKDKTVTGGKGANVGKMATIHLPVTPCSTTTTGEWLCDLQLGADFMYDVHV